MIGTRDSFFPDSPTKLLRKAGHISNTLARRYELPKSSQKQMVVKNLAKTQRDDIQFAIEQAKYQQQLFRKLEEKDKQVRSKYQNKIEKGKEKVKEFKKSQQKTNAKEAEQFQKHLKQIYRRYDEEEKKHRGHEKEESNKLRKELQQFYSKQQENQKKAHLKQISISGCYQSAVERINQIHKRNQQYGKKAEKSLDESLIKNSHFGQIITKKKRVLSSRNRKKSVILNQSMTITKQKQNQFIQTYGHNQDASLEAFKFINQQSHNVSTKINKFFKDRHEKWVQQKRKVDQRKAAISDKCTGILDRTTRATFRNTMTTFRSTGKDWQDNVRRNKSAIKQVDELQKDDIMSIHLDLRLKNNSSSKITEKMQSMRGQAKKLANDFL